MDLVISPEPMRVTVPGDRADESLAAVILSV
jgi:hypothetical protein